MCTTVQYHGYPQPVICLEYFVYFCRIYVLIVIYIMFCAGKWILKLMCRKFHYLPCLCNYVHVEINEKNFSCVRCERPSILKSRL